MQRVWCAFVGCPRREKRGGVTPDGQVLPDWLSWSTIVTTIDGQVVTTGEVVNLPLTYYGESIPLGDGWEYGGLTRPSSTSTSASTSASATSPSTSQPSATVTTTSSPSSSGPTSLASSSSLTATSSSSLSSSSLSSTSSGSSSIGTSSSSVSTSTPSPILSSSSSSSTSSSSSSTTTTAPSSSSSSSSSASPTATAHHSHRNIPRIVLPSVLVPLFVLALLFLLLWCCLKRRREKSEQQRVAAFQPVPTTEGYHEKVARPPGPGLGPGPGGGAGAADPGVAVPVGAAAAGLGVAQPIMRISPDDAELHAPNYDDRRRSGSSVGSSQSGDESSALLGRSRPASVHSSKYSFTGIGTAAAAGSAALMARLGRGRRPSTASQFSVDSSRGSQYSNDSPRNVSGNTMERMVGVQMPSEHGSPRTGRGSLEGAPWGAAAGAAAGVAGAAGLAAVMSKDRSSSGGSRNVGSGSASGGTRSGSGTTRGGSGARHGSGGTHVPGDRSASGGTEAKRSSGRLSSDVGSADLWYNNRQTITASPDEEIAEALEEESPPIAGSSRNGSSGQYVTADSGSLSSYVSMGTDSTRSIYATQGSASSKSSRGSNRSQRSKASSGSRGSRPGASGRLATTIPEDSAVAAVGILGLGASAAAVYHARRSRNNTDETDIAAPRTSAAGSTTPPAGIPQTLEAAGPSGDIGEFGTRIFVRQPTGESEGGHSAPLPSSIGRPSFSERNTSVGTFGTPVEEDSRASSDYPSIPVFSRGRTSISSLPATPSVPEDNSPLGSIASLQTHAGYFAPAITAGAAAGAAAVGAGGAIAAAGASRQGTSQADDSPNRSTAALAPPTGGIRRESTPSHLLPGAVPIDPGSGALLSPFGQVGVGQLATPLTAGSGGSSNDNHGRRPPPRQHPLAVPAKRHSGQSEDKRASGLTDTSDPFAPIAPSRVAPTLGPGTNLQRRPMSRSVGDLVNTIASAPASAHGSSLSSGEGPGGNRPRVAVLDEFGVVHDSASRSAPLLSRTLWSTGTGTSANSGQSTGTSALGSLGSVSEYGEPHDPMSPASPAAVIGPSTPDRAVRGRISKPEMVQLPPSRQNSEGNSSGSDPPRVERPLPPLPTTAPYVAASPETPRPPAAFRRVGGRRGMAEGEEALLSPPRGDDEDDDDTPRRQAGWSPKWFKWSPNKRG